MPGTSRCPTRPWQSSSVVLTVPASFDAAARELTREAALAAGLPQDLTLLEEPQAAVYNWLDDMQDRWRRVLSVGDTLLVCDVGGGTTDLTLVGVSEVNGELELRRMAVGNHLLVGGDNMDLALAHWAAGKFAEQGVELDPWQSVSLWHSCRAAKEELLAGESSKKNHTITVAGRGSKLIGKSKSVEVLRDEALELLMNGFFPRCDIADRPSRGRASGFQEIGLPFEADTAITRHLAAFLHAMVPKARRRADGGVVQWRSFQGGGLAGTQYSKCLETGLAAENGRRRMHPMYQSDSQASMTWIARGSRRGGLWMEQRAAA